MSTHNTESQLTQPPFDGPYTRKKDTNPSFCSLDEESSLIPTTFERLNSPKNNSANPSSSPPMFAENDNYFSQDLLKENFLRLFHLTPCVPSVDLHLPKWPKMSTAEEKSVTNVSTQLSKRKSNNPLSTIATTPNRPVQSSPSVKKLLISKTGKKTMNRISEKSFKSALKIKHLSPIFLTQTLKFALRQYLKKSHRANKKLA